jgi:TonB-dependent receptor
MRIKLLATLGIISFVTVSSIAQTGKITGRIIAASSGQNLSNATLLLIETKKTGVSDLNGNFSFGKLATGNYSIKCSFIGYSEKIIEDIKVTSGETVSISISLDEKSNIQTDVVVTSRTKAGKETVASLLVSQKNSANVSDGISAEIIRKTPDRSSSDVIKRVSGASIQDDRFAIIRGLNDRYNASFINGAPLPSTESDRKAFAFDIFPSSILDNLVIYKTATPDLTGEFGGGIINITTKSTLPKNFTSITIGSSQNSLATGNERQFSANKGNTDFLGIDDGTRGIPSGLPTVNTLKNATFAQRAEYAKLFGNYKWGIRKGTAGPNYNFQISKGLNFEKNQREFIGAILSVTYSKSFTFNAGERNSFDFDASSPNSALVELAKYKDSLYNEETILSTLANFSMKINNKNTISWKNNFSINTDNRLAKRYGTPDLGGDPDFVTRDAVRWFTSNQIFSSQLAGDHQIGEKNAKLSWLGSFSKVNREIPNLARTSYAGYQPDLTANFGASVTQALGTGTMFFTNSDEDIQSIKADFTQPYTFQKNKQNSFKVGAGYQLRKRNFSSRLLGLSPYRQGIAFDNSLLSLPEDKIFIPDHLGKMKNGMGGFLVNDATLSNSDYDATSTLTHGYVMNDQRLFKQLRLIYGARVENFNQKLNSFKDINLPVAINTTVTDVLPSVNLVYAATKKINFRLSYSKTINRPEFRELAPYLFYDFVTQFTYEGFDTLQRATINNYDFRFELFPGKAQLISVSAFYKDFTNPIEIVSNPVFKNLAVYSNAQSAKVYGAEIEFRTLLSTLFSVRNEEHLLSKFTLSANAAYIKSSVKLGRFGFYDASLLATDRALQGQSPYLINSSLAYADEKTGFSSTLSINRVGDRISIAGTVIDADIYEQARTVVDFQIAKTLLAGKLEIKLTGKDLLSQKLNYYFDFDKSKSYTEKDRYFSSTLTPKIFNLNISYKF